MIWLILVVGGLGRVPAEGLGTRGELLQLATAYFSLGGRNMLSACMT